jgi:hypothetical protein
VHVIVMMTKESCNAIVTHNRTVIDNNVMFDLLHPIAPVQHVPKKKLCDMFIEMKQYQKLLIEELKMYYTI